MIDQTLGFAVVDDGPADGGLHRQLPHAQHVGSRGADRPERPRHRGAAVLVDPERLPARDHAAADLRLRHGHHRAEDRVRDLRDRLVLHQHGARPRRELADALRPARAAGVRRRIGQSRRHEGDVGVVPRSRTRPRRWILQHGCIARLDAGRAARRVGDPDAQLAVRVRPHGRDRPRLGGTVADVLSVAFEAPCAVCARARVHPLGTGDAPGRDGQTVDRGRFLVSETSGALLFRGFSPTRRGGRSPSGCRCI